MNIVIIGSGNIATFFAGKFHDAGYSIGQVYSRRLANAQALASKFGAVATDSLETLLPDADFYLFAVKDDVLLQMASSLRLGSSLVIHTAGSVNLNEISDLSQNLACIWCVYSIQKEHLPVVTRIPLVLQCNQDSLSVTLKEIASAISPLQYFLNDTQKPMLHMAAVFANNFTNHMYTLAKGIAEDAGIPFEILLPMIQHTAEAVNDSDPGINQTGPAIRNDQKTLEKHQSLLQSETLKQLYSLLSKSIQESASKI